MSAFDFVNHESYPEDQYIAESVTLCFEGKSNKFRVTYIRKKLQNGGMFWGEISAAVTKGGEKKYQEVNSPNNAMINYDERAIRVSIQAGVSFQVQKTKALAIIVQLMSASEEFASFMNSPMGLPILLENIECYGSDRLKEASTQWLQQQQQQQQQMMQMQQQQQQSDPAFIRAQAEMMKVQQQKEQDQVDNQLAIMKLQVEKMVADSKVMEAESKISNQQIESSIKLEQSETSQFNHATDAAVKFAEIESRRHEQQMNEHHAKLATHKLHHEINQASKTKEE